MDASRNGRRSLMSPQFLRRYGDLGLRISFVIFGIFALLGFAGRYSWVFDNLTAFLVQFVVAAGCFLVLFSLLRRWRWGIAAIILLLANLIRVISTPATPSIGHEGQLRIVSVNVHTSNRQFDRFVDFIHENDPDILLVMEVDKGWEGALSPLRKDFPHVLSIPREDNFGLMLLSRLPFDETQIIHDGDSEIPMIIARVTAQGRSFTLVGAHPLPPVSSHHASQRNRQFVTIAQLAREEQGPVVVVGDLNVAPWSPFFHQLLRDSGLRDSRSGFGINPSWPTFAPMLMTPIDHALVSAGIEVVDRRTGHSIGSDHLPIVVDIAFSNLDH